MSEFANPEFLFFDLGKVVIDFDHEQALSQLAEISGCSVESVRTAIFETDWPQAYERGTIDTPEFCNRLRDSINSDVADEDIFLAMSDIFRLNREIVPLLAALQQSGIRMGLLSNTCDAHWRFLHDVPFGILELFPVKALSFELGTIKPEPEIYVRAAELAGVDAARIFFTDDQSANVQGACAAGWDAVVFTGVGELYRQLHQRGLRFNY